MSAARRALPPDGECPARKCQEGPEQEHVLDRIQHAHPLRVRRSDGRADEVGPRDPDGQQGQRVQPQDVPAEAGSAVEFGQPGVTNEDPSHREPDREERQLPDQGGSRRPGLEEARPAVIGQYAGRRDVVGGVLAAEEPCHWLASGTGATREADAHPPRFRTLIRVSAVLGEVRIGIATRWKETREGARLVNIARRASRRGTRAPGGRRGRSSTPGGVG